MDTIWWYIGAATIVGGVQLVLGIVVGLLIRRGGSQHAKSNQADAWRAREFAQELAVLTGTVSRNVDRHQARIDDIQGKLDAVHPWNETPLAREVQADDSLTHLVVGVVSELMRANQDLQSQLSSAEEALQRQTSEIEDHLSKSMTDELTGLPNRRAFEAAINGRMKGWRCQHVLFTLMILDIDLFKRVNDVHGHVAGDLVLRNVAETVKKALRKPDLVTRYGGEEFAVLLPYTALADSTFAAKNVLAAVESAVTRFEESDLRVTVSIGLAAVMNGESATELLKRADAALYEAKGDGRNCGYMHDGQQLVRIEVENTESKPVALPNKPSTGDRPSISPKLEAICAELRDMATELADDTHQAAADDDAVQYETG